MLSSSTIPSPYSLDEISGMKFPPFTLLAFHYFEGEHQKSHPGFELLLRRLEAESARVDQGAYILRTQQDASLIDECVDYLHNNRKPYALLQFDPTEPQNLRYGSIEPLMAEKIELWISDLEKQGK
jgi:hypothetical protein